MQTTPGSAAERRARTTYCSPPLVSAASDQLASGSGWPVPRLSRRVDVEPGRLGLGLPQVDEPAAQLGVVDQVGAVEVQLDVGDRHRLAAGRGR